jgi:hypothetical protein
MNNDYWLISKPDTKLVDNYNPKSILFNTDKNCNLNGIYWLKIIFYFTERRHKQNVNYTYDRDNYFGNLSITRTKEYKSVSLHDPHHNIQSIVSEYKDVDITRFRIWRPACIHVDVLRVNVEIFYLDWEGNPYSIYHSNRLADKFLDMYYEFRSVNCGTNF